MIPVSELLIIDLLAYLILFIICSVSTLNNSNALQDVLSGKGSLLQINLKHISSILIIIVLIYWHPTIDPSGNDPYRIFKGYYNWLLAALAIIVISISTRVKITVEKNQSTHYSYGQVSLYLVLRIFYLVLYEIYFRNLLLYTLSDAFNNTAAIILSSLLYCIIHLFNRRPEFLFSLPFGVLLAWLSFETFSVYPAIILHLLLSVPFEYRLLYHLNKPHHGKDFFNRSNRLHW